MKCARLNLQERRKPRETKAEKHITVDRPRRCCQKRMVNPKDEDDPRWTDVSKRFHCDVESIQDSCNEDCDSPRVQNDDIYLSVQTLKFHGDIQDRKRPRTCFKYKALTDGKKHRMFIKQIVNEQCYDDERLSRLTCYYFDDYVKYLISNDRSRPSTGKSSNRFICGLSSKFKEKGVQVDTKPNTEAKVIRNSECKHKKIKIKQNIKNPLNTESKLNIEDAKIEFHKSGKRKSLTISRTQSPETVQVIRVDVVCNHRCSDGVSDKEESSKPNENDKDEKIIDKKLEDLKLNKSPFAKKYLLTNTVKTLDENVSSGAKVTLLCKTFKLSDRSKIAEDIKHSAGKESKLNNNKINKQPK